MSLLNYSAPFPAASSPPPYYQPVNFQPHQSYQAPQNNYQTYHGNQGPYNAYSYQQRQQGSSQGQPQAHVSHQVQHPQSQGQNQQFQGHKQVLQSQIPSPNTQGQIPEKPPGFTRVDARGIAGPGTKTQVHAVIDYDEDEDYYDDIEGKPLPHVTPIQGPIFLKNGTVPVVPLFSYPQLNNGSFIQIPILWTALSVALGLEIRGEIIRGVPCIKRYHQLFCPTAGTSYPLDRIELFIDENKALMKRMYGDFQMGPDYGGSGPGPGPGGGSAGRKAKRSAKDDGSGDKIRPGVPDLHAEPGPNPSLPFEAGDSYFSKLRRSRQAFRSNQSESGRLDACESKTEIVTPYWASNSAGKIRAIVNTQHFEQAIHQEVCSRPRTGRCSGDCGCEQKYKWHRLLAYDPDNDCKGIFMDWFLFPSCCVCRCNPT